MLYSLSTSMGVASSLKIVSGRLEVGPTSGLTSGVVLTSELAPTMVKEDVAQCLMEACQTLQLGVELKVDRFPSSP